MKKLIIASVAILMALTACVKDGLYPYTTSPPWRTPSPTMRTTM